MTFLDRERGLERFAEIAPELPVVWPTSLVFDSFQVGLSNNRSGEDQALDVDDVRIEVAETP